MACPENNPGRPWSPEIHLNPEIVPKASYALGDDFQEGEENASLSCSQKLSLRPSALQRNRECLYHERTPVIVENVSTTPTRMPPPSDIEIEDSDTQGEEDEHLPRLSLTLHQTSRQHAKRLDATSTKVRNILADLEHYQGRTLKALARTKLTTLTDRLQAAVVEFDALHDALFLTLSEDKQFITP